MGITVDRGLVGFVRGLYISYEISDRAGSPVMQAIASRRVLNRKVLRSFRCHRFEIETAM